MSIPYSPGDKVTVIRGDSPDDPAVGKTGTVYMVDTSAGLIVTEGIAGRIEQLVRGRRAFRPDQLRKN